MKFDTELTFQKDDVLINLDRVIFLNIRSLRFIFDRDILTGEFDWIRDLQYLEALTLTSDWQFMLSSEKLSSNSIAELEESFSGGIPSLKMLDIRIEIFESTFS